ncbi:MAG: Peptidase M23 family protein [Microgenomates group bacterium GW2011_GWC1_43_13]|uniref:Peptidase M23 family protein n=3 Tax=Candidatus Woeseibacteriota TaxID=1752722 RepID=A0A837IKA7_9BACT|nr:MAG: Peptidase M23 family protein [Microgenomates group bacterium GW2011_GWC1_43_13]KKT32942.1 MAG: Peptidase M23 family protein [Candidatus Woesebacteria bacterium GW2011_GWB1_44_11]KKT54526.1 MAG: Peptidase M23 family protein [Candidatus Woesebacteria bacterium GW2011_GWA1_44_23]
MCSSKKFASHPFIRYHLCRMDDTLEALVGIWQDIKIFLRELANFAFKSLHISFLRFEEKKGVVVTALYRKRGKLSRTLSHSGMVAITALGVMMAPIIAQEFPGKSVNPWSISVTPVVLSASTDDPAIDTQISSKVRDSVVDYKVQSGDTVASIANKFGVSADTVRWGNGLTNDKIKVGQTLKVMPVTGITHTVAKGDTVYSIAKKYDADSQAIVDFPFNTFTDDETFELAIGQIVVVPDGVMPAAAVAPRVRQVTPDAGTVTAMGQFVWPTAGRITQRFSWYHPGLDIANSTGTPDVAADSGRVIYAGWDTAGYGNMVLIDHGNGYKTRYAHLSQIMVISGQNIGRGQAIGKMGSTGRSSGPHTHFEIFLNGVRVNPLNYLR